MQGGAASDFHFQEKLGAGLRPDCTPPPRSVIHSSPHTHLSPFPKIGEYSVPHPAIVDGHGEALRAHARLHATAAVNSSSGVDATGAGKGADPQ